ncbi:hypothetical protein [Paenarthrobacter nitroguajacolicus]|nr:hypothetical protein [Paenarthrobacter nitroguajacolicus]
MLAHQRRMAFIYAHQGRVHSLDKLSAPEYFVSRHGWDDSLPTK